MLSWKRTRSEENHKVESMENPIPNDSKRSFSSFLRMSSRVFSGQFFVDACNSLKTVPPPSEPSNLVTPKPPKPTKSLKRWVPNKVGLGVATLRTDDLVSKPDPEHDNVHKSTNYVVHRPLLLSNGHILGHSSTNHLFEDKSFYIPIDPSKGYGNGDQEKNANEMVTFSIVTSPEDNYFLPPRKFMSYCHTCIKELDHSQDIFIYRGDKSFCSEDCREQEICFDEIKLKKKRIDV